MGPGLRAGPTGMRLRNRRLAGINTGGLRRKGDIDGISITRTCSSPLSAVFPSLSTTLYLSIVRFSLMNLHLVPISKCGRSYACTFLTDERKELRIFHSQK